MPNLETAIVIATEAHEGQLDKQGAPYILHPLRVLLAVAGYNQQIIAVLHDVIEDTKVTLNNLEAEGFDNVIICALEAITKVKGECYTDYIKRVACNKEANVVKIADLRDNLDKTRGPIPATLEDRYHKALYTLVTSI